MSTIEVEAEILRGSCTPVFFVGETIECEIRFKYNKSKEKSAKIKTSKRSVSTPDIQKLESVQTSKENEDDSTKTRNSEMDESMFSIFSSANSTIHECASTKSITSLLSENAYQQQLLDGSTQQIAWACAQIDCHCFIDESKVILPKDPLRYNTNDNRLNELNNNLNASNSSNSIAASNTTSTSFQPNKDRQGISVFSSKPKILFCNLLLKNNQVKTCKLYTKRIFVAF